MKGQKLRPIQEVSTYLSLMRRQRCVLLAPCEVPRQGRGWKRNRGQQFVTCSRPGSYGRAVGNIPHRLP